MYVRDKLNEALQVKIELLEKKKEEEQKELKLIEKMTKKEKEKHQKDQERKNNPVYGMNKKKKKTFQEQERELHEAYQILLAEHYRKVKSRTKQKLRTINIMKTVSTKTAFPEEQSDDNLHEFARFALEDKKKKNKEGQLTEYLVVV